MKNRSIAAWLAVNLISVKKIVLVTSNKQAVSKIFADTSSLLKVMGNTSSVIGSVLSCGNYSCQGYSIHDIPMGLSADVVYLYSPLYWTVDEFKKIRNLMPDTIELFYE